MSANQSASLATYIRARYPLLLLESPEEQRAIRALMQAAAETRRAFVQWSVTDGFTDRKGAPLEEELALNAKLNPSAAVERIYQMSHSIDPEAMEKLPPLSNAVVALVDFHHYLDQAAVLRRLRDLFHLLPTRKTTVVFVSPALKLPPDLAKEVTSVPFPLPTAKDLWLLVEQKQWEARNTAAAMRARGEAAPEIPEPTPETTEAAVNALLGLTQCEAENALAFAVHQDGAFRPETLRREKESVIRQSGVLEFVSKVEPMENVGGMANLKAWLAERSVALTPEARSYGLPTPRGILIVGLPGTGKSLLAKAVPSAWSLPLAKLGFADLLGSLVGEAESRFRQAWATIEAVKPVVVLMDEIDKALKGHDTGNDSGVMSHLVGQLLTKLQERDESEPPIFVVATANDYESLPEPLLRKGRFDEMWWVDLPGQAEREAILRIHLKKRNQLSPVLGEAAADLVRSMDGFIGAEIEQVVVSAMYRAFSDGRRPVQPGDLREAAAAITPIGVTKRDSIQAARQLAKGKLRWASDPKAEAPAKDEERRVEWGGGR